MDRPARPRRRLGGVPRRRRARVRRRHARGHGGAGARAAPRRPRDRRVRRRGARRDRDGVLLPGHRPRRGRGPGGRRQLGRRAADAPAPRRAAGADDPPAARGPRPGRRAAGDPLGVRAGDLRPVRLRPGQPGLQPGRPPQPDRAAGRRARRPRSAAAAGRRRPTGRPSCRSTTRWPPPGRASSLREEPWWQRAVRDLASMRGGSSPKRAVVAEDGDGVRGFALYRDRAALGRALRQGRRHGAGGDGGRPRGARRALPLPVRPRPDGPRDGRGSPSTTRCCTG